MSSSQRQPSAVVLASAVQFTVILDATFILSLGPDLCTPLAIPASALGLLFVGYTLGAAISGLLGAPFLDRFPRRTALLVALLGLVASALAATTVSSFAALLVIRTLAGMLAAPATTLSHALIADKVAEARRGTAFGKVLGFGSAAAVTGVPLTLWLSSFAGWQSAFLLVSAIGLIPILLLSASRVSIQQQAHEEAAESSQSILQKQNSAQATLSTTNQPATSAAQHKTDHRLNGLTRLASLLPVVATFLLVPNLSAYVQFNLGYPRESIPLLYMSAGLCGMLTVVLTGRGVDRFGTVIVGGLASLGLASAVFGLLVPSRPWISVELGFILFFVFLGMRNTAVRTLISQATRAGARARFLSVQTSMHHLGAVIGAALAMMLLQMTPDGTLVGMSKLAIAAILLSILLPLLLHRITTELKQQNHPSAQTLPSN